MWCCSPPGSTSNWPKTRASGWRDERAPGMRVKSGMMVGLGETLEEILATMKDIRDAGTDVLTIGQYLQPHARRLPVERWWTPEEFATMRVEGRAMGFAVVESGPLVRSSYHARAALGGAEGGGEVAAPL